MKYLFLVVLSFNVFCNFKVSVQSAKNQLPYMGRFNTELEANEWIQKNVKNNSWGKPQRWVEYTDQENCLQIQEVLVEELQEGEVAPKQCELPAEYTITITDITEEVNAEKALKEAEKAERDEIKALIKDLDKYETVGEWRARVNKILIRLIKDSRY